MRQFFFVWEAHCQGLRPKCFYCVYFEDVWMVLEMKFGDFWCLDLPWFNSTLILSSDKNCMLKTIQSSNPIDITKTDAKKKQSYYHNEILLYIFIVDCSLYKQHITMYHASILMNRNLFNSCLYLYLNQIKYNIH